MSIRIVRSGLQVTVQDLGRYGSQDLGVPVGGAMDDWSARLANLLVGNAPGEALLEVTLHGLALLFESQHLVAVTGGGAVVKVNDEEVPMGRTIVAKPWSAMRFHPHRRGMRSYLAIAGGIDVPTIMGSRSTYLPARIGGHQGRALEDGDVLYAREQHTDLSRAMAGRLLGPDREYRGARWSVSPLHGPDLSCRSIRFFPGPEWGWLTEAQQERFCSQPFVVTSRSDRMGYRLRGQPMVPDVPREMISSAVTRGSVQLTHEGQPVLLMADAQTTGGYPRIAQVAAVDLPVCAQYRPGDRIFFKPVSFQEASSSFLQREQELDMIGKNLSLFFNI